MPNNNNAVATRLPFTQVITTEKYQKVINNALQDPKRAQRFVASISSAVANNPALQNCDAQTVLASALLGESLNLSPSPQLGQYYMVPFNNTKRNCTEAQFILGYKGYIQLALRSGYYKKLNVTSVKEGELVEWDEFNEEIQINPIKNDTQREQAKTAGYYAMFEYQNGFRKCMYWSHEKMESHALKYSKGYAAKKGYTFWEKDFDAMAYKTMLRQLIGKWGIMSLELQTAFENDVNTETDYAPSSGDDYIESEATVHEPEENSEAEPTTEAGAPEDAKQVSMSDL